MGCSIKYLIMDVDGTLTDGKIYMANSGELFKAFNIKDGYGIGCILPKHDITPIIITGRTSKLLAIRCHELGITYLYEGVSDKLQCLRNILRNNEGQIIETAFSLRNCAYIGDDLPDVECMAKIKAEGGITGCPNDAVEEVKHCAQFISIHNGGEGAVRDFIDYIVERV